MKRLALFALLGVVRALAALRPKLVIPAPDGSPYMTRWHLTPGRLVPTGGTLPTWKVAPWWTVVCRWVGSDADLVALHCIHQSDPDRGLHNHPYRRFKTLILGGSGYIENRYDARSGLEAWYVKRPGTWNRVEGEGVYHAVYLLGETFPTWTLMLAGPKHGHGWGFMDRDGTRRDRMAVM